MQKQYENEDWNERWQQQKVKWQTELLDLLDEVESLLALIDLANSQIKSEPPE